MEKFHLRTNMPIRKMEKVSNVYHWEVEWEVSPSWEEKGEEKKGSRKSQEVQSDCDFAVVSPYFASGQWGKPFWETFLFCSTKTGVSEQHIENLFWSWTWCMYFLDLEME